MTIAEDRDEFNTTGLRGLVLKTMASTDEAFFKEIDGGHRGELLSEKPAEGSGPYLHYKRGNGIFRYSNSAPGDTRMEIFRVPI